MAKRKRQDAKLRQDNSLGKRPKSEDLSDLAVCRFVKFENRRRGIAARVASGTLNSRLTASGVESSWRKRHL